MELTCKIRSEYYLFPRTICCCYTVSECAGHPTNDTMVVPRPSPISSASPLVTSDASKPSPAVTSVNSAIKTALGLASQKKANALSLVSYGSEDSDDSDSNM